MRFRNRQRLKLMLLMAIFFMPLLGAWGMIHWQTGIPEGRTAHGELAPPIPRLKEWPLVSDQLTSARGERSEEAWWLVFDCEENCNARADQWWRVHRALGRHADRLMRLRIGGGAKTLPGGTAAQWISIPAWRKLSSVWVLDPHGRAVLAYPRDIEPQAVLEDIRQLLKVNPTISKVESHGA